VSERIIITPEYLVNHLVAACGDTPELVLRMGNVWCQDSDEEVAKVLTELRDEMRASGGTNAHENAALIWQDYLNAWDKMSPFEKKHVREGMLPALNKYLLTLPKEERWKAIWGCMGLI
jgi:hypothetical protein